MQRGDVRDRKRGRAGVRRVPGPWGGRAPGPHRAPRHCRAGARMAGRPGRSRCNVRVGWGWFGGHWLGVFRTRGGRWRLRHQRFGPCGLLHRLLGCTGPAATGKPCDWALSALALPRQRTGCGFTLGTGYPRCGGRVASPLGVGVLPGSTAPHRPRSPR